MSCVLVRWAVLQIVARIGACVGFGSTLVLLRRVLSSLYAGLVVSVVCL